MHYIHNLYPWFCRHSQLCLTPACSDIGIYLQASVVDLLLNVWYQVESKEATPKSSSCACNIVSWGAASRKTFTMMTSGSWKYCGIRELDLFKSGLRVLFFHSVFINGFLIFLRQFSFFFFSIFLAFKYWTVMVLICLKKKNLTSGLPRWVNIMQWGIWLTSKVSMWHWWIWRDGGYPLASSAYAGADLFFRNFTQAINRQTTAMPWGLHSNGLEDGW